MWFNGENTTLPRSRRGFDSLHPLLNLYYNIDGEPISLEEWSVLLSTPEYQVVAQDHVGDIFVSTVWLGLNHNFGFGSRPLIFETMVFGQEVWSETMQREFRESLECYRYSTYDEAVEGHAAVLDLVRKLESIS